MRAPSRPDEDQEDRRRSESNHLLNWSAAAMTLIRAVDQAMNRFHSVPLKSKMAPSSRNAAAFDGASVATNCGRNARKNSATLGFKTFVRKPWKKMPRKRGGREGGLARTDRPARSDQ